VIRTRNIKQEIVDSLLGHDMKRKMDCIRDIPLLESIDGIEIMKAILACEDNLSLKLEALRIMPQLLRSTTVVDVIALLHIALDDPDSDVVRWGLLTSQSILPFYMNNGLIDKMISLLNHEDTDVQYEAIVSLVRFRRLLTKEELVGVLAPFIGHANRVLSDLAERARDEVSRC